MNLELLPRGLLSYSVVVDASRVKETVGSLPGVLPDFGGDVL